MKNHLSQNSNFEIKPEGRPDFFYSGSSEEAKCIGHLRADFGSGDEYHASWWPHEANAHNTPVFREEFQALMTELRKGILRDRRSMQLYLCEHPGVLLEEKPSTYGYLVETQGYRYFIRCAPYPGYYDAYVYCYLAE